MKGSADARRKVKLGDFVRLQRGHDLPATTRRVGSIPVMGSAGITGYHDTALAKGPGVTIGRSGRSMGVVSYSPVDYWPHNSALFVTDFLGNDPRFAYYLLQTIDFQRYNSGSVQEQLNRNLIYSIEIEVPDVTQQSRIARMLGGIEDKIDLNHQMNETLEAMARAVFRSWFVDFDPVRAKVDGRQPDGLDAATAGLFPDTFEDSALGTVPKDWRVGRLGEIATNCRRGIDAADVAPGTPYLALEHMPRRCMSLDSWETQTEIESNKFRFNRGEILFGKLRPYFHKVGIAPLDGVCSTDILVITPKASGWFGFALCHFSSDELVQHADATSTGTKMPRTSWTDLSNFEVTIPDEQVVRRFDAVVQPLVDKMLTNIHESRTLAALRDALLPKLLSGELRVGDSRSLLKETT